MKRTLVCGETIARASSPQLRVLVPADVPPKMEKTYIENYRAATKNSGNLMLFAGDQKIEHLNEDFYGPGIHPDDGDPEHLFRIASRARIGVFATQLGLIARYGRDYPSIDYLVKLNSKTNLVPTEQKDPYSKVLNTVSQVVTFAQQSGLRIRGVGYTIYLGSEFESSMLSEAASLVFEAHQHGLLAVLWIYPRGKAVKHERDPALIAGATGVAACLGADFVKVNPPKKEGAKLSEIFPPAIRAAGRTKVICAGGSAVDPKTFLASLAEQLACGVAGNATGRNIHQRSLDDAIHLCNAIYALTVEKKSLESVLATYYP